MKKIDTWEFAHEYCGKFWWRIGLVMVVTTILIHIPFYYRDETRVQIRSDKFALE